MTASILSQKLRKEAARKSDLDRDKQLLIEAANEIEMMLSALQAIADGEPDPQYIARNAIAKATGAS